MKVTFFLGQFPATSETFVINQIAGLIKLGLTVEVVALRRSSQLVNHAILEKYDILSKTRYLLPENEGDISVSKFIKRLFLISKNIFTTKLWLAFDISRFGSLAKSLLMPALYVSIREPIRTDVFIAHFGVVGIIANNLKKLHKLEGKLLTVVHGADISKKNILLQHEKAYLDLFNSGTAMLPISQNWSQKLCDLGCPPNKIKINRMGINTEEFTFRELSLPLKKRPIIMTVARFTEKKGITYAIEALTILAAQSVEFEYWLIGDGPLKNELKTQIDNAELNTQIKMVGLKSQEELREMLKQADIFLLPSVTASDGDMEGIPVVLMEAMATGLVTISTQHSGIPELIENGVSGFLAPERDAESLAKLLMDIFNRSVDIEAIRINARNKIEEDFNQHKLYQELAKIIQTSYES
ncbi:glycosyltransferase [Paraglaciecola hydrolytica]|uniref:Glycosyl transferase family 1 domain-containing protein n=1 Tax=Paraglaciecola hydrolytica TaxID=1799789 RepID=A0A135ZYU9_9ALTE|nr:glycosyltransferase [Paraglaciecola hydrolytica]KXI28155.1 hypothetical protein AX660_17400 [Paraglaciecola hydrolytica]